MSEEIIYHLQAETFARGCAFSVFFLFLVSEVFRIQDKDEDGKVAKQKKPDSLGHILEECHSDG